MSQVTETICDQCGARKGSTNHWWKIYISKDEFSVYREAPLNEKLKDMCGENCVAKALDEWLSSRTDKKDQQVEDVVQEFEESLNRNQPMKDYR
jgi:hypothetical protein